MGGSWGLPGQPKGWSWSLLGALGRLLGRSWILLGRSWADLSRSWVVLGGSWGLSGRPKIDHKIDPKLDSKTGRIATGKHRSKTTPVNISVLSEAHWKSRKPMVNKLSKALPIWLVLVYLSLSLSLSLYLYLSLSLYVYIYIYIRSNFNTR